MRKSEREQARELFGRVLAETGDYRLAAEQAGVAPRTGRRWRAALRDQTGPRSAQGAPRQRASGETAARLFGRDEEIDSLTNGFDDSRVALLHGVAGVGKTRVAIEVARGFAHRREVTGAHLCRLSEARDADDVLRAMARALGVRLTVGNLDLGIEITGREIAARGRALLILDGWDRSLSAVSPLLQSWMRLAPEALFLVTSSSAFELPGLSALAVALEPLAVPSYPDLDWREMRSLAGVRLLLERGGLAHLVAAPSPPEQRAVGELAALVGGVPLALEIAAAGARQWEPTGLFVRLAHHPSMREGDASRDLSARAQVESVIDWAVSSLAPDTRAALACVSVFCGDFTFRDATMLIERAAITQERGPASLLAELSDRALLHESPWSAPTIRLHLPTIIRRRAQAELSDADERRRLLSCHADLLLSARDRVRSADDAEELVEVHARQLALPHPAAESAQRAALAAIAVAELPGVRLPAYQEVALLDRGLEALSPHKRLQGEAAHARLARAQAYLALDDVDAAANDLNAAVTLAETASSGATQARALATLAVAELFATEIESARAHVERAITIAREAGDRLAEGRAEYARGLDCTFRGQRGEARRHLERALVLQRSAGDREGVAQTLTEIAGLCHLPPHHDLARGYYTAARSYYGELGDRLREAHAVGNLGLVEHTAGRLREADDCYGAARELCARTAESALDAILAGQQGAVAHERGQNARARSSYQCAVDELNAAGEARYQAIFTAALGTLEATEDRIDAAAVLVDRAGELSSLLDDLGTDAVTWLYAAHVDLARARRAEAAGDAEAHAQHLLQAQTRLESATLEAELPEEGIIAARMLRNALAAAGAPSPASATQKIATAESGATLFMDTRGRVFRAPGGAEVSLGRRKAVRRVLLRLLLEHEESPGRAVPPEALVEAGWPERKARRSADASRAETAITTLRDLGLAGALAHSAEGWYIEPGVTVRVLAPTT